MPADEQLVARVERIAPEAEQRRMFGGVAFMVGGKVACCVLNDTLLVRLGIEEAERSVTKAHVGPFVMGGRPQRGWVVVEGVGVKTAAALRRWVAAGIDGASA